MDLDKLHEKVKKLDALLTERETGTTSWWIILGNLVREINDTVFPEPPVEVEKDEIDDEDNKLECECYGDSHYFTDEWIDEWSNLARLGSGFVILKDCPLAKDYRVIKESEHFILGYIL